MPAYIYLIVEDPHEGELSGPWTKIGYSQNPPEWRMTANLRHGNPRVIRVAKAFEFESSEEALAAEQRAHLHFADVKHPKEWFRVAWQEVAAWLQQSGCKPRSGPD